VAGSVVDNAKLVQGVVLPDVLMQFGTSVSNVIDFFAIFTDNGAPPDEFCRGVAESSTHGALSGWQLSTFDDGLGDEWWTGEEVLVLGTYRH
jgi:hypothetical protein